MCRCAKFNCLNCGDERSDEDSYGDGRRDENSVAVDVKPWDDDSIEEDG